MFNKIFFQYRVISRKLTLMTRKSKSIRLLYLNYVPSPDGNFATIKFRFSNAVFYQIGNFKTLSRSIKVMKNDGEQQLNLTVHGFFRKNEYILTFNEYEACLTRVSQNHSELLGNIEHCPQLFIQSA